MAVVLIKGLADLDHNVSDWSFSHTVLYYYSIMQLIINAQASACITHIIRNYYISPVHDVDSAGIHPVMVDDLVHTAAG